MRACVLTVKPGRENGARAPTRNAFRRYDGARVPGERRGSPAARSSTEEGIRSPQEGEITGAGKERTIGLCESSSERK